MTPILLLLGVLSIFALYLALKIALLGDELRTLRKGLNGLADALGYEIDYDPQVSWVKKKNGNK